MLDITTSLTLAASQPEPYIHLDNRAMVICNGSRCVMIPAGRFPWVVETFALVTDERRATRRQGDHALGGFVTQDAIVLFAGYRDSLVSVALEPSAFEDLRKAMAR